MNASLLEQKNLGKYLLKFDLNLTAIRDKWLVAALATSCGSGSEGWDTVHFTAAVKFESNYKVAIKHVKAFNRLGFCQHHRHSLLVYYYKQVENADGQCEVPNVS